RRAGVSAFGVSGTNVHVILADAEADATLDGGAASGNPQAAPGEPAVLAPGPLAWLISARSEDGLARQAGRLAEHLQGRPGLDPADVAWSLAATRSAFEYRAVVTGT